MKKGGYNTERELVHKLREAGFDALRVPVSAPSREPLPDVFAIKGDAILSFEVRSQERYAYYKRDQVAKLHEFLEMHRVYPRRMVVLAAKFKYKGWTFTISEEPGDYSLRLGRGIDFRDLVKKLN